MAKKRGPVALIVIDGWGYSVAREGNAIALAETPFYDELSEKYPRTLLEAHGSRVGLPAGVMGNSEVGHLNIGAGRVIRMDVSLVDHEIETGEFFRNKILSNAIDTARERGKSLHLMGLISDGQVHSSLTHLYALLKMAKDHEMEQVFVHCFLDGRDTPPSSAAQYVAALQRKLTEIGSGQIATVVGRYYAMDRDKRWERTQRAYDLLTKAIGERAKDPIVAINDSYQRGVTDEFVEPIAIVRADGGPIATIKVDDSVIFCNYRLAETEKYAHVTYFFNGGVEKEYPCEQRLLVPSPKIATYDLQPEMSAFKVTDKVLRGIDEGETDVFVINFANPDMVGHTGKLDKTIEACQYVDTCLGWITKRIRTAKGITLITADHGNAEQMRDPVTGSPHTAHTTNPVPFHLIDEESIGMKLRTGGALEDVAPTLLGLLGLEKPTEMTGRDLREL